MTNYLLKIGNAGFTLEDLPEQLPLGGEHTIAVRKFPGGRIHVQTLGAFEDEMSWDGEFFSGDAWSRAKAIDNMRISGKEVLLQFGAITRYVIVSHFNFQYQRDSRLGYSITLQPTRKSGDAVSVGSVATIKSASPSSSPPKNTNSVTPPKTTTHVIQKGDTFFGIAVKYYGKGSEWPKIQAANPKMDSRKLQIGQKLIIPL